MAIDDQRKGGSPCNFGAACARAMLRAHFEHIWELFGVAGVYPAEDY
jgi:hypothetical protein